MQYAYIYIYIYIYIHTKMSQMFCDILLFTSCSAYCTWSRLFKPYIVDYLLQQPWKSQNTIFFWSDQNIYIYIYAYTYIYIHTYTYIYAYMYIYIYIYTYTYIYIYIYIHICVCWVKSFAIFWWYSAQFGSSGCFCQVYESNESHWMIRSCGR